MLLYIEFSPIHPSVSLSVSITVALHSALSFLIRFCFLESLTGTRFLYLVLRPG